MPVHVWLSVSRWVPVYFFACGAFMYPRCGGSIGHMVVTTICQSLDLLVLDTRAGSLLFELVTWQPGLLVGAHATFDGTRLEIFHYDDRLATYSMPSADAEGGGTWTLATETTGGYYPNALTRRIWRPCAYPNIANGRGHQQRRHAAKASTSTKQRGELKHQVHKRG